MRVVGLFESPLPLDQRLGFGFRTNEPKLGRLKLLAGDQVAHADFVDRFLFAGFLPWHGTVSKIPELRAP